MFYSSFGSFIHKLLERYYLGLMSVKEMKTEYIMSFQTEVEGERPPGLIAAKYFETGLKYFDNFKDLDFEVIAVEKKLLFDIDGHMFIGFADLLCKDHGDLMILDHKSRDLSGRSNKKKETAKDRELDEMLTQLYIYSRAVESEYGELPKKLCFNCFRNGNVIIEPFKSDAYSKSLLWAKNKIEEIKDADEFRPRPDFFKCRYLCSVHHECCYYDSV